MEQHKHTNRYGTWRKFEIDWNKLSSEGHQVNVKAVFVEGDEEGTYSHSGVSEKLLMEMQMERVNM